MERHLSPAALARLFTGQTAQPEAEMADAHAVRCPQCLDLAARVAAGLRRQGKPAGPSAGRSAVLAHLEAEERTARRRLLAHTGWAELRKLAMEDQLERIDGEPELQTIEMFQTVLADAAAQDASLPGEERAFVAHILAGRLPEDRCPPAVRHDLQGQALLAVAGRRRRVGDLPGAKAALESARSHFEEGTGDPVWLARHLAAQASQAAEAGHLDRARACLSHSSRLLREAKLPAAVAAVEIQAAETFLAAGRRHEAMERAEDALRWLPPQEARLGARAQTLLAECLAGLGRPEEALRRFLAASPPGEQPGAGERRQRALGDLLLRALECGTDSAADVRPEVPAAPSASAFDAAMERYERQLIAMGLAQCSGCILETARLLDISRNTLKTKIKLFGLAGVAGRPQVGLDHPALSDSERQALDRLRAKSSWEKLRRLPAAQQIEQIEHLPSFQTLEMFEEVLAAAVAGTQENPLQGEETALVAQALVHRLPRSCCPEALRLDLLSETLRVIGNCRRLSGDWPASAAALAEARRLLEKGTGDPQHEARLLSVEASLASDTGKVKQALKLLARAAAIYSKEQDLRGVAGMTIQEAGTLLAAGRYEEAIARAEDALRALPPKEFRLELLARSILTECFAFLGRPMEALRSLVSTWPLFEHFRGRRSEPQLRFLEGLVLDALGYMREAEAAYHHSIVGYLEAGLYKDAFLTMLTRFETLFRRGAWKQAARACEEALALESQIGAPGHGQMIDLWRDLLTLVNSRRLTEPRVLAARQAMIRHWSAPAPGAPAESSGSSVSKALRWEVNGSASLLADSLRGAVPQAPEEQILSIEPPAAPFWLAEGAYKEAIEGYERQLIEAGLAQGGGRIRTAARLLGIHRRTLRARIAKYGLSAVE